MSPVWGKEKQYISKFPSVPGRAPKSFFRLSWSLFLMSFVYLASPTHHPLLYFTLFIWFYYFKLLKECIFCLSCLILCSSSHSCLPLILLVPMHERTDYAFSQYFVWRLFCRRKPVWFRNPLLFPADMGQWWYGCTVQGGNSKWIQLRISYVCNQCTSHTTSFFTV